MEPLVYTWEQFFLDCKKLGEMLPKEIPFKAIARSGLIVAGQVAQFTNTRKIDAVCLSSHDKRTPRGQIRVFADIPGDPDFEGVIIDDNVDTGTTMEYVKSKFPKAKVAVLQWKPPSKIKPDFYVLEVPKEQWVIYPWEID